MKKVLQDQWVQVLVLLTAATGVMTFFSLTAGPVDPGVAATSASPAAAPAASAPLAMPAPAPSSPSPTAGGLSMSLGGGSTGGQGLGGGALGSYVYGAKNTIKGKTPGKWVVDAAKAPDSDTSSVEDAVWSAADGDEVLVRPGYYAVDSRIENKKVFVHGEPGKGDKTILGATGRVLFDVKKGGLVASDLVLRSTYTDYGDVVSGDEAKVELKAVRVEAKGNTVGVRLKDSFLSAESVHWSGGRSAVDLTEQSTAKIKDATMTGHKTSIGVFDRSELDLQAVTVDGGETGIYASKGSKLSIRDGAFRGQGQHGVNLADPGSKAEIAKTEFSGGGDGFWSYEAVTATITACSFKDLHGTGVYSREGGRITVTGGTFESVKTGIAANDRSAIDATGVRVAGSNKYGAEADGSGVLRLVRSVFEDNGGPAVYAHGQGRAELLEVKVRKTSDLGVFVGENSKARIDKSEVTDSLKAGVALGRDATLEASGLVVTGSGRCGMALIGETAKVKLTGPRITGNECGVSFVEGGDVASSDGDFTGNKKGAFMFQAANKSKIALTGAGNRTK